VADDLVEKVRTYLHLPNAGLGLCVGDPEVRAARRVRS
jgi:hypothetical protein